MRNEETSTKNGIGRRKFLKSGMLAGGVAVGAGLLGSAKPSFSQSTNSSGTLTSGDIAILRFLSAAEQIESDLWQQYAELGGVTPGEPPVENSPNFKPKNPYQAAFMNLDGDGPQYITSNTLDEISHATFLNAYLESQGAPAVDLSPFAVLPGSTATGAKDVGRITNLMNLNVDTSWFIRYRSTTTPDFGTAYPQAVTINGRPAIPRTNADFNGSDHVQVLANTAAFHFGAIEQGGSSLYAAMAQKASSLEVLQIILGIGADEVCHFLEWVDFAGNGVQQPVAPVSSNGLTFPNFFTKGPLFQPNLIFPVPAEFIHPKLPLCAAIRPLNDAFAGAVATAKFFTNMNLFSGQSSEFFGLLQSMAEEADAAQRSL